MNNIDRQNEFIDMLPEFSDNVPGRVVSAREFPGAQVCFLMGWKEGYVAMPHADGTYPSLDGGWGEYEIMGIYNDSGETWTLIECHDYKGLLEGEFARAFPSDKTNKIISQDDDGAIHLSGNYYGGLLGVRVSPETLERLDSKREEAKEFPEEGTLLRMCDEDRNVDRIFVMLSNGQARDVLTGNIFDYEFLRALNNGEHLMVPEWPKAY